MNHFRQGRGWLLLLWVMPVFTALAPAQNVSPPAPAAGTPASVSPAIMPPPLPALSSPVDYFRNLLAMSPQEREQVLAKKPEKIRERILTKVNEYAALDPDERELRLRATELHWYLLPLLRAAPEERNAQLARVPDNIRGLVQARLMQWEILPPSLQQEFLDNEHTVGYFAGVDTTNGPTASAPSDAEQSRWNALPDSERQAMTEEFNEFFAFSPVEKKKAMGGLSDAERARMEKTLQTFSQLQPPQRVSCIRAFGKFTSMSPRERTEFLRNAEQWTKMTPRERKAWCDLVDHVPQWPPLPPLPPAAIMPPMPEIPQSGHVFAATNRS